MTKFNDGGRVFPCKEIQSRNSALQAGVIPYEITHLGMTYRQWLAGMVVNGLLSNVWKDSGTTYTEAKLANETIGIVNALIAEEERTRNDKTT